MFLTQTGRIPDFFQHSNVADIHFSGFYGLSTYNALGNSVFYLLFLLDSL